MLLCQVKMGQGSRRDNGDALSVFDVLGRIWRIPVSGSCSYRDGPTLPGIQLLQTEKVRAVCQSVFGIIGEKPI